MPNSLRPLTENDLIIIKARVDAAEQALQIQQKQSTEVTVKLAVFEAALKRSDEDVRRIGERHEKSITDLKTSIENNYNSTYAKLDAITNALGLDGTAQAGNRLRENLKGLDRTNTQREETLSNLRENILSWSVKCLIVFVIGAVVLRLGLSVHMPEVVK